MTDPTAPAPTDLLGWAQHLMSSHMEPHPEHVDEVNRCVDAISAFFVAAPAAPAPEPVAWIDKHDLERLSRGEIPYPMVTPDRHFEADVPLYTHPAAPAASLPAVEEVMAIARKMQWFAGVLHGEDELRAAVERIVRERNYYRETCNHWAGGQWQERAERAEREAAELLSELKGAANYIDTLGGDSKKYRIAIAAREGK